ncbi:ABC transporter permease [Porcincola intestinalis]|uniref:ABC transporter permease n=1 Tax=Porcincola intestinalis TaxID=2606632 RepID=UPI0023F4EE15|nr:ABC transporter permease [Porcincola intestinalis]MDD7060236.1 ABC transporter permease [Porcincola intestinalis]MDY5284304.1 ABC transporter permease [Porcincola intestinalis]
MSNLRNHRKTSILKDQRVLLALVIIVIIAIVALINPLFIAPRNIITIFQQISVNGILTMAMAMVLISGGIDLSIGSLMVLSGVAMAQMISWGMNMPVAVLIGLVVGIACGLANGLIIALSKCPPMIITLGMSQVFYGIALTISNGRIMSFKGAFDFVGKTKIGGIFPVMLFVLAAMIFLSSIIMRFTKFGRRIVAIGGNETNAYLSGINITRYKVILYGLVGAFCAVAAVIFSSRIDSITANAGTGYETNALTAAVMGGVTFAGGEGTISGAFLGCILIGVISNAMNILQVQTYIQTIVTGAIIVAAIVLSNITTRKRG